MIQLIDNCRNSRGIWWPKLKKDTDFYNKFSKKYKNINHIDVQFKAYIVLNDLNESKYNCLCGQIKRFNKNKNQMFVYCSSDCSDKYRGKNISNQKNNRTLNDIEMFHLKRKKTNMERYGYTEQFIGLKKKIMQTNLLKYGEDNFFKTEQFQKNRKTLKYFNHKKLNHLEQWLNFKRGDFIQKFGEEPYTKEIQLYFNNSLDSIRRKLNIFNIPFKKHSVSFAETEIFKLIPNSIQGDRKFITKELDILNHDYKFAVEYQGLMFHSHGISKYKMFNNPQLKEDRHIIKTQLVDALDYQLFQIYDNEWLNHITNKIWISILNSKMNLYDKIVVSDDCNIKKVSYKDSNIFESLYNLNIIVDSNIRYGLFYNNDLIALMTFKNHSTYDYELISYCVKNNINLIGGKNKLLKNFEDEKKPTNIIVYVNRRWSNGKDYMNLGFKLLHHSIPNSFYFKQSDLILKSFDDKSINTQVMFNNGYRKIYDSGNSVLLKNYN